MPSATSVEARFAERVSEVLGLEAVAVRGRAPRGARRLPAQGLSKDGRKVLEASGYRTLASLAQFDLARLHGVLSVPDLHRLAEERARARFAGIEGLTKEQASNIARHLVAPVQVTTQLGHCGSHFGDDQIDWFELQEHLWGQLEPKIVPDLSLRPHLDDLLDPDAPWTDPPRWTVDDLVVDIDFTRPLDRQRMDELLTLDDADLSSRAGELVRLVEGAVLARQDDVADRALSRLMSLETTGADIQLRHLQEVVAPAIGIAADPSGAWVTRAAAEALRAAPAGLRAADLLRTTFLEGSRREAQSARRLSMAYPAEVRASAGRAAADAQARLALGLDAYGKAVDPGLTTQGIAAMADVQRAFYAAVLGPETRAFPTTAPSGLAGRATVSPIHHVSRGGLADLGPAHVKGATLAAFGQASALHMTDVPLLGGDVFRFDWLLDETRAVVDQLEGLDQLLIGLLHEVSDATGQVRELGEEALEQIGKVVEQIRQQVDRLSAALRSVVADLTSAAMTSTFLLAVSKVIADWKVEQWIAMTGVVAGAVSSGADPVAAVDAWITGELRAGIGSALADPITQLRQFRATVKTTIGEANLPDGLATKLTKLLADSGVLPAASPEALERGANDLLKPILDARDAAVELLVCHIDEAIVSLEKIANGASFSPALKIALVTWVVAPIVVAVLAVVGLTVSTAGIGTLALTLAVHALALLGIDVLERLAMGILGDVVGAAKTLQKTAESGLAQAGALVAELGRLLTTAGGLDATLTVLAERVTRLVQALLPDELAALRGTLFTARDAIRGHLTTLLAALDRSFFRETLTAVAQPGELTLATPSFVPEKRNDVKSLYSELGLTAQLGSLLPRYEATRVGRQTLSGATQTFTHVLSLADVLQLPVPPHATPVPSAGLGALLETGGNLPFTLTQELFDRIAPGVHEQLIRDVALHVDFATPVATEQAFAALLEMLSSAAGGTLDPALVARTGGFGWPALPIVPTRLPTGLPAVLSHAGTSRVRVSPVTVAPLLAALSHGPCGSSQALSSRPPSLAGVRLLPDPDPAADAAGWRVLEIADRPQSLMFSHFELVRDTVRFEVEPKELKPFELRSAVGTWTLEVPALLRGFVDQVLPPIRDVRLVLSTQGRWSRDLARTVAKPSRQTPVEQPIGQLPATLDDLLERFGDLLDSARLQNLLALEQLVELPAPSAPGNLLRVVPLLSSSLTASALALALTGAADATFPALDPAGLGAMGIDATKVVGVRAVRVGLLPDGTLAGASLPDISATVTRTPLAGGAGTVGVTAVRGVCNLSQVELAALGPAPLEPEGVWSLRLGDLAGATLSTLSLLLVVEQTP